MFSLYMKSGYEKRLLKKMVPVDTVHHSVLVNNKNI